MSILKNTTLAAIVRDEIMNPAGGVERWLRSTLPYVEEAVVVDTGSIDGTREKLNELSKEFPHLRVYDRKFDDFSSSRNYSLDQVSTKMVLVLDADEIIADKNKSIQGGFVQLGNFVNSNKAFIYKMFIDSVYIYGEDLQNASSFNTRLFLNDKKLRFRGDVGEFIFFEETRFSELGELEKRKLASFLRNKYKTRESCLSDKESDVKGEYGWNFSNGHKIFVDSPVRIKHFKTNAFDDIMKNDLLYNEKGVLTRAPRDYLHFPDWKVYNPRRDVYN
ncbi:MAG: glycosyltransferase [Nanoarchaeota archaeon]